jgi:hypothetical protein
MTDVRCNKTFLRGIKLERLYQLHLLLSSNAKAYPKYYNSRVMRNIILSLRVRNALAYNIHKSFINLFLVRSMTKEICGSLATATQHKGMIIDTNLGPVL